MFVTLWLKGVVIFTMGNFGMGLQECNMLKTIIENDIRTAYIEAPEKMVTDTGEKILETQYRVSCMKEQLPIGYMDE